MKLTVWITADIADICDKCSQNLPDEVQEVMQTKFWNEHGQEITSKIEELAERLSEELSAECGYEVRLEVD